jgi:hypothetical protein
LFFLVVGIFNYCYRHAELVSTVDFMFFELHYHSLFSAFCLDAKSGAKKSGQTRMLRRFAGLRTTVTPHLLVGTFYV